MKQKKLTTQAVRRLIFVLITVFCHIVQFTWLPRLNIPFPVFLLIPLLVSTSMFEREFTGMLLGLLTGALWDLASPLTDGFLALFFTVFGCICGLLSHYIMRNTLLTAMVLTTAGTFTYSAITILYHCLINGFTAWGQIILKVYLPALVTAVLLTVPFYFLVRKTVKHFRSDKAPDTLKR